VVAFGTSAPETTVSTAAVLSGRGGLAVFLTGREIAGWDGALFPGYYAACTAYLVLAAQRHAGAGALGDAMLGFVVPLAIVTLGVAMLRKRAGPD
jgi:cation:H+ antiporter